MKKISKSSLRKKFKNKEAFTKTEYDWMDGKDWHPIDELPFKADFVGHLIKISKSKKFVGVKRIDELLKP